MKSIFTVLQDIERLIYKILLWIILIPKTVIRIILYPRWAAQYIRSELNEGQSRFDEYVSPVILLLVVALLPSLGYNALPKFGVTLTSPAETTSTTDRFLSFEAQADFISASPEMFYFSDWEVRKKNANGDYDLEKSDSHPREDGILVMERVDNNTVKDRFLYAFSPGEYLVSVSVKNMNLHQGEDIILETYDSYLTVTVPVDNTAQVVVSSETDQALQEKGGKQAPKFLDRVKEEQTIFLALALMIPPLLFAFSSQIFKVKWSDIGEETLKEDFYVQCYYFSPLSLAIWGTYYANYFFTEDAYWRFERYTAQQILLLPLIWATLWFIRTEVKRIAWELDFDRVESPSTSAPASPEPRKPMSSKRRTVISFLIVTVCILLLGYGASILFSFNFYMDDLRLFAIRAFPAAAILLVLSFAFAWFRRRKDKGERVVGWNIAGLAFLTLIFFGVMNLVKDATSPSSVEYVATKTQIASVPNVPEDSMPTPNVELPQTPISPMTGPETPTQESTPTPEPPRFYTEEFNSLPPTWFNFMTYGDPRMVKQEVGLGKLSINIQPLEHKRGWYYLINDAFTYSDVKVEAVVTNQGNNGNGVSLICRYSDVGWYEFDISNSGLYQIYAVDNQGIINQGYNGLADGGSTQIKSDFATNVYTATCKGNELSLFINGAAIKTITDKNFRFAEGRIGLAVSSPEKFPVKVDFESLIVSEP